MLYPSFQSVSITLAYEVCSGYPRVNLFDQWYSYIQSQCQRFPQPLICFNNTFVFKIYKLGFISSTWLFYFHQILILKCILSACIFVFWTSLPIPHPITQFHTKNHTEHFKQLDLQLEVIPADNHRGVSIECQKSNQLCQKFSHSSLIFCLHHTKHI